MGLLLQRRTDRTWPGWCGVSPVTALPITKAVVGVLLSGVTSPCAVNVQISIKKHAQQPDF
jgi:hypothetical protein